MQTRTALLAALAADVLLFTSPNAVRAAATLHPLHARHGQHWLAVGRGTQRALARAGIAALAPTRMDSEGLLGLPALANVHALRIALVTAPGGRGVIAPTLQARGAQVLRVDVYARAAVTIPKQRWALLATALRQPAHVALALSSGEALHALLAQTPPALLPILRKVRVAAASARLAQAAHDAGFRLVEQASSARPADVLAAIARTWPRAST